MVAEPGVDAFSARGLELSVHIGDQVFELRSAAVGWSGLAHSLIRWARYARSFHELPAPIMELAEASLVQRIDGDELNRALGAAIELFVAVAEGLPDAPVIQVRELR